MEKLNNQTLRHFLSRSAVLMVCAILLTFIALPYQADAMLNMPDDFINLMDSYEWNAYIYGDSGGYQKQYTSQVTPVFSVSTELSCKRFRATWKPAFDPSFSGVVLAIQCQSISLISLNGVAGSLINISPYDGIFYYKFNITGQKLLNRDFFELMIVFEDNIKYSISIVDCYGISASYWTIHSCNGTYGLAHRRNSAGDIVGSDGFSNDTTVNFETDESKLSAHGSTLLDGSMYLKFAMSKYNCVVDKLSLVVYSSMPVTASATVINNSSGTVMYVPPVTVSQSGKSHKVMTYDGHSYELYVQLVTVDYSGLTIYSTDYRMEVSLSTQSALGGVLSDSDRLVYISVSDGAYSYVQPTKSELQGFASWLSKYLDSIVNATVDIKSQLDKVLEYLEYNNSVSDDILSRIQELIDAVLYSNSVSDDIRSNLQEIIDILNGGNSDGTTSNMAEAGDKLGELGNKLDTVNRPEFSPDDFNLTAGLPSTNFLSIALSPIFKDSRLMFIITFVFICAISAYVLFGKR